MAAPTKFAHVVYQTHRFEEMIDWYTQVFEATVRHKDDKLAFLSYDDEHHRMAFLNLGPAEKGSPPKKAGGVGVHHVAYTWKDLGELVDTYKRLKSYGVLPAAPIRHGLTLSLYYQDPDGNMMEFQIDALDPQASDEFMRGPAFAANPVGEPFDPEELAGALRRRKARRRPRVPLGPGRKSRRLDRARQRQQRSRSARDRTRHPRSFIAERATLRRPKRISRASPRRSTESASAPPRWSARERSPRRRSRLSPTQECSAPFNRAAGVVSRSIRRASSREWCASGRRAARPAGSRLSSACTPSTWGSSRKKRSERSGETTPARASRLRMLRPGRSSAVSAGFRLTGRWGFSSGVDYCAWVLLGGIIPDEGSGPEFRTFLVPRRDFKIDHQSWQVSGLQGTGSKDLVVDSFVPEHRTHRLVDNYNQNDPGRAVNPGPYFRMPWLSMFAYAIATPAIGAAVGALDAFVEDARSRFGVSVGSPAAANPFLHLRLAEALTIVADARARIASTWGDFHAIVRAGQEIPVERRARCRYEAAQAIGACLGAVLHVFEVGGGGVMQTKKPFQRQLRDLMAIRNHPFAIPDARASTYARCVLGLPQELFVPGQMVGVI